MDLPSLHTRKKGEAKDPKVTRKQQAEDVKRIGGRLEENNWKEGTQGD